MICQSHALSTADNCSLVSICLPAFNCEKTLTVAIRSILNQTYGNWELLLMEDGSSDRTLEVAQSFSDPRISVFTDHSHKGLVSRLNQAVAMSRGEYFARMDADDVAYPERLERQVGYLARHPEVDLLGCGMIVFKSDGHMIGVRPVPVSHEEVCRRPLSGFRLWHPTWMGRTVWFRSHPYCSNAIRAEDQELLLRSFQTSRFANLRMTLLGYREDSLALNKILASRRSYARAALQHGLSQGSYFRAPIAVFEQLAKGVVDVVAVGTGLEYRLVRHRALKADELTQQIWGQVWSAMRRQHESEFLKTSV